MLKAIVIVEIENEITDIQGFFTVESARDYLRRVKKLQEQHGHPIEIGIPTKLVSGGVSYQILTDKQALHGKKITDAVKDVFYFLTSII
jgi:hypothetical protein